MKIPWDRDHFEIVLNNINWRGGIDDSKKL